MNPCVLCTQPTRNNGCCSDICQVLLPIAGSQKRARDEEEQYRGNGETIKLLPEELRQQAMVYLSIKELERFCETVLEFDYYCHDPQFMDYYVKENAANVWHQFSDILLNARNAADGLDVFIKWAPYAVRRGNFENIHDYIFRAFTLYGMDSDEMYMYYVSVMLEFGLWKLDEDVVFRMAAGHANRFNVKIVYFFTKRFPNMPRWFDVLFKVAGRMPGFFEESSENERSRHRLIALREISNVILSETNMPTINGIDNQSEWEVVFWFIESNSAIAFQKLMNLKLQGADNDIRYNRNLLQRLVNEAFNAADEQIGLYLLKQKWIPDIFIPFIGGQALFNAVNQNHDKLLKAALQVEGMDLHREQLVLLVLKSIEKKSSRTGVMLIEQFGKVLLNPEAVEQLIWAASAHENDEIVSALQALQK